MCRIFHNGENNKKLGQHFYIGIYVLAKGRVPQKSIESVTTFHLGPNSPQEIQIVPPKAKLPAA